MTSSAEYATPREIAERIGVTKRTVLRWIRNGRIETLKFSDQIFRIPREEAERFIAQANQEGMMPK